MRSLELDAEAGRNTALHWMMSLFFILLMSVAPGCTLFFDTDPGPPPPEEESDNTQTDTTQTTDAGSGNGSGEGSGSGG